MTATTMTTGSSFINRFPGTTRGTSGGGAIVNSPPGVRGMAIRARRTNPSVVEANSSPPQNPDTRCASWLLALLRLGWSSMS